LTIKGGKQTTYREMAKETVDEAVKLFKLPVHEECQTKNLKIGGHTWSPNLWIHLVQKYEDPPLNVAKQLSRRYGLQSLRGLRA
jgi:glycerol-3-phosphate dehydrogenase